MLNGSRNKVIRERILEAGVRPLYRQTERPISAATDQPPRARIRDGLDKLNDDVAKRERWILDGVIDIFTVPWPF
ncbi:MAG: hypothetical protein ACKVS9_03435 [Phycisphaerae bacterium]